MILALSALSSIPSLGRSAYRVVLNVTQPIGAEPFFVIKRNWPICFHIRSTQRTSRVIYQHFARRKPVIARYNGLFWKSGSKALLCLYFFLLYTILLRLSSLSSLIKAESTYVLYIVHNCSQSARDFVPMTW